ncbi:MAG TPA: DUF262 domain-containing protein, partial [Bacteroidia bacterium]|nr:DUF262 domain-containing protein [Bacteroidia bacterium]
MKANETKLQPIIEGTKQYVVPLFQRTYSWDKKEWDILWKDIDELCHQDNPRDHFVGSIVTMPTVSVPEGVAKFLLIDGQQRLTTIFLILAALRDIVKSQGNKEFADEINNTLIVNPYKKENDYYKLMPTQVDRELFTRIVDEVEGIPAETQVLKAYKYFDRKIRSFKLDLNQLKKVLVSHFSIVSITLDPDDNPYLVFESLNAKGRPLSQADLIRNYFFMRVHIDQQEDVYKQCWYPMQVSLEHNLTNFIRHFLMRSGEQVRENDVYFILKEKVSAGNAITYLKELGKFATYYKKLISPDLEEDAGIRKMLLRLNRLEVTTAYPFLLSLYSDYEQGRLQNGDFMDLLKVIENYIVRRFICNIPTNQLNKIFVLVYPQLIDKEPADYVTNVKNFLQSRGYPKDSEFKSRLMDTKLYGAGDRLTKTKLILESIEEWHAHKEQVPFDELTIEHVMPQTLSEWWQHHLGEGWEIVHELFLHVIGNLTLTAYNTELSNDDFIEKRKRLGESHLEMNKYFQNMTDWKKEEIEKRSDDMSGIALKVWPYFGNETTGIDSLSDVTGTTPSKLWILGQELVVKSWRDVLEQTLNTVAELEPEKFDTLIKQFPKVVSREKSKLRAVRQLSNGAYVEVNLSAQLVQKFCYQFIETIELTADD